MRYFSVAYQPVEWALPGFVEVVSTDPAGDGVLDLGPRYPHLAGRGAEMSEFATLFALRRLLETSPEADVPSAERPMVGISHYRRFAVTRPVPRATRSFAYDVVRPDALDTLPDDLFLPPPGTLVLPAPVMFDSAVVTQYGRYHPLRDLLHFMGIAIDLGVADARVVAAFLGRPQMIVAPSVGVYPVDWLVRTLASLESVVDAFDASVAVERDGYQRRAIGFCLERLFALLAALLADSWPSDRVRSHRALLVSDDGVYRDAVGRVAGVGVGR